MRIITSVFIYKDGSWIIPNLSSNLCTHQPKFAHAHTFPYSRAASEFLRRNSSQESFKKENQCLHTPRAIPMVLQSWIRPPTLSGLSWGCWVSAVRWSLLSCTPRALQRGQGVQLMLISGNTRQCLNKGLQVRHQVQSCFEEMWWARMVSSPAAQAHSQGSEWGCLKGPTVCTDHLMGSWHRALPHTDSELEFSLLKPEFSIL